MTSFSLPSASGMVSLLNDRTETKGSGTSSEVELNNGTKYRNESSGSTSSINSPLGSSFQDGGSSSDGSKLSISSALTSQSSDSVQSGKISEIHSLRRQLEGQDIQSSYDGSVEDGASQKSSDRSSENNDDERGPAKKRKAKELHEGSNQRSKSDVKAEVLDQPRLAASPQPMGSRTTDANKVPMNMHKATSMSETDGATQRSARGNTGEESSRSPSTSGGKRRYPCSHPGCDKTFSTSGHAARHNRIHTGSKPYRCTFPGCNASFSRQDNSLQHYRTHVLHPKSRGGGSYAGDGKGLMESNDVRGSSTSSLVRGLDPETEATMQMGRKALEEGTAIAVVHEVVDGNGRKGEAVQRMVGQPRTSRRGSASTSRSDHKDGDSSVLRNQTDDMDEEDDEMVPTTGRSYYGHSTALPGTSRSNYSGASPITYQGEHSTYHPSSHHAATYPPTGSPHSVKNAYMTNTSYRPYGYSQAPPAPPPAWQHSGSQEIGIISGSHSANEMPRRGSSSQYPFPPYSESLNRMKPHVYNVGHSPSMGGTFMEHKRSHSLNGDPLTRSRMDWESKRRSLMGKGDSNAVDSDSASPPERSNRNEDPLSLLPYGPLHGSNGGPLPSLTKKLPVPRPSLQRNLSHNSLKNLQLPSISKLPYSSDRSTSTLTPTTPLDDLISQHGVRSSEFEQKGRVLPPLRVGSRKLF